jgi:hypothetical protein
MNGSFSFGTSCSVSSQYLCSLLGDLFRRHDISGFSKAIWVIALILVPISRYLSTDFAKPGDGERNAQRMQQTREELRTMQHIPDRANNRVGSADHQYARSCCRSREPPIRDARLPLG